MKKILLLVVLIGAGILGIKFLFPDVWENLWDPKFVRGELVEKLDVGPVQDALKITLTTAIITRTFEQEYKSDYLLNFACNSKAKHVVTHTGNLEVTFDFSDGFEYSSADSSTATVFLRSNPYEQIVPNITRKDTLIGVPCAVERIPSTSIQEDLNLAEKNFNKNIQSAEEIAALRKRAFEQMQLFLKNLNNKNVRFVIRSGPILSQ